ncbi:MAG TPA: nuclear transport factor 2 family protein [Roseiarcus sp.]|nr:nuclear transport factor 2 family protein [Roseiarcus sp.]
MDDAQQALPAAVRKWLEVAKTSDRLALEALLAPDVVFDSPVVHTPQRGKGIAATYLSAAILILGGADFRYVAEWVGPKSAVLEFVTIIDGIEINGVDIIGWSADEQIDRFKVMVRPLKAIQILHQKMAAALSR